MDDFTPTPPKTHTLPSTAVAAAYWRRNGASPSGSQARSAGSCVAATEAAGAEPDCSSPSSPPPTSRTPATTRQSEDDRPPSAEQHAWISSLYASAAGGVAGAVGGGPASPRGAGCWIRGFRGLRVVGAGAGRAGRRDLCVRAPQQSPAGRLPALSRSTRARWLAAVSAYHHALRGTRTLPRAAASIGLSHRRGGDEALVRLLGHRALRTTWSNSAGTSGTRSSTDGGGSLMCAHIVAAVFSRG